MNVCVLGLWHLGTVTAACLAASGHEVTGLDFDVDLISGLSAGIPPVFEPGLEELLKAGLLNGRLRFASEPTVATRADVVWVTYDTPVDEDDRADVAYVVTRVQSLFPYLLDGTSVVVSSQVPVGTTARLERDFERVALGRQIGFAYSPENLRLGKAIAVFTEPDRVVVGARLESTRDTIAALLKPITERIEWMSVESAEMTKHAVNAFLATSVAFINEIASICEVVGADAAEVERGLKSEARIGPKAYLSAGGAFAGGTLARDVVFLSDLALVHDLPNRLLPAVKDSNDAHQTWAARRLSQLFGNMAGVTVAIWGLTYKPGTDALRRSMAVDLCRWLIKRGAVVRAHDPVVSQLPPDIADAVTLVDSALSALRDASALVVCTAWPSTAASTH